MALPMRRGKQGSAQRGFVYIALLIGLAVIAVGLSATGEVWYQSGQREKEEELLFTGNQIRQAITLFYQQSPAGARRFPTSLEELVEDRRLPDKPQHLLRKLYADPMTGTRQWGEVRLAGGQLVGVYSMSTDHPFKLAGFARRDKDFLDKSMYSDWVFRSPLPAANPVLATGAGSGYSGAATAPGAPQGVAPGNPLPGLSPQSPRRR